MKRADIKMKTRHCVSLVLYLSFTFVIFALRFYHICSSFLSYLFFTHVIFSSYWMRLSRMWRVMQIEEDLIHLGLWRSLSAWMTSSESETLFFTHVIFVFQLCHIIEFILSFTHVSFVLHLSHINVLYLCHICSSFMLYLCFAMSFMSLFVLHLCYISPY